jgi:hypothetical protein
LDFDPAAFQEDGFSLAVLPDVQRQEPGGAFAVLVLFDALADDPTGRRLISIRPKVHPAHIGVADPDGIVMTMAERISRMTHTRQGPAFWAGHRI